jgi:hypothetical protein
MLVTSTGMTTFRMAHSCSILVATRATGRNPLPLAGEGGVRARSGVTGADGVLWPTLLIPTVSRCKREK